MVAISAKSFRPNPLGFGRQPTALVIVETQSPAAELFAKNTVLFAQILDHLQLVLVHPPGHGNEHEPERI
jgi:hypothetical protein